MKRKALWIGFLLAACLFGAAGCSTTRVLADDEARLADNKVSIVDGFQKDDPYSASSLQPYIKQKANSTVLGMVTPLLYIYNWQNGRGGGWDRFCQKVGEPPVIFDEHLVDDSVESMLDHLRYDGWYDCTIEPSAKIRNKIAKVSYDVTLGKRFPISDITYRVRDTALASLLAADSAHFTVRRGDPLAEVSLEKESERLAQYFRNNGYWGFSKNYFFFYADTTTVRDTASLIVAIENYTRNESEEAARPHQKYKIGNVALIPQPGMRVRQAFLHNLNQLAPGEPYSEERINRTYDRFASIPLFSSVNMMLRQNEVDSTAVDCRILLQQARLQSVKLNLEGSFNSTGLFGVTPSLSYSHKNLFGGGEVLSLGFRGNFQFMLKSPVRATEFSVSTGLGIPWYPSFVWKMPRINLPQMDVNFMYSFQDRPEYNRNIVTGTYGFSWNVDKHFYYQIYPIQLSAVQTSRIDEDFYKGIVDPYLKNSFRSHLDLGGGGMFYFTTNSTVNPKVSYFYTRFQFDISGNMASLIGGLVKPQQQKEVDQTIFGIPYSQYARGELQVVETLRMGPENQFALALRGLAGLGYAYGNSLSLPFEKLFYAGGAGSLRGWRARAVGPGMAPRDTSFKIVNQSGDMHLEADAEFRFPLFSKLQGAVFLEAGNVWNIARADVDGASRDPLSLFSFSDLARSLAVDWGLGLRLDFGLILVRFDLGLQLYDPSQQAWKGVGDWVSGGSALHFGIGYPF
ncbi:MAG: BamA/TamA family outer membrane protein [Bacteroidales bacterium]|nr:BamA/TamA family outer membrane protein [Bacteroidales bacterium]